MQILPFEHRSVMAPDGTNIFGMISVNVSSVTGLAQAEIRLLNGFDTGQHKGFGLRHIETYINRKNYTLNSLDFRTISHMVWHVCRDFDRLCAAREGRFILYRRKGKLWIKAVIGWNNERSCWHVVTALPTATSREQILWEK